MPGARRGHRGGKRSRGAAASEEPAPAQAGRKTASYAKLIAHMHHAPSHEAGEAVAEEEDADVVAPAPTGVADDDEAAGELDVEEEAEGEESGDEEEELDSKWRSASHEAHYAAEWTPSELDARRASWREVQWQLTGLGSARARVSSTGKSEPSPPHFAVGTTSASASAEAVLRKCGVLPSLRTAWRAAHGDGPLSAAQASLLGLLTSRTDIHCAGTRLDDHAELLPILALHAAGHIVVNQKTLQRHKSKGITPQDQGFTRPSVLVLLPFRSHALAFVRALLSYLPDCYEQVENRSRFVKEYEEEAGGSAMPQSKPEDYRTLFEGNHDDCFRCALRLTRKAAKLYAPFYVADLIVGSPLGLRTLIGSGGTGGGKKAKKAGKDGGKGEEGDADWLSSIELAMVGFADVLLMQNWAHVHDLFELMNELPRQQRETDFSRVRPWYLEGDARRLRQTVLLSQHPAAELSALFQRQCSNVVGRISTLPSYTGVLAHAPSGIRQLFVRFECSDPALEADARLAAFRERLLPSLLTAMTASTGGAQTMLFVPRYFDFVRVRQLLIAEDVPFVAVSEYSTPQQASRARTSMQKKEVPLLIYTERAHFFRRHAMRGARHLAVYSPPSYAHFYTELLQQLDRASANSASSAAAAAGAPHDSTCVLLFCRLDTYPLQRLVGDQRASRMLSANEASFLFS